MMITNKFVRLSLPLFVVFGLSQIALYTASALYHSVRQSPQGIDRLLRFDCAMVFVLIAGTYTPICLIAPIKCVRPFAGSRRRRSMEVLS